MSRRVVRLTLDNLPDLVAPCDACVFFQLDPVARGRACGQEHEELAAWVSATLRDWGSCGRLVVVDDRVVGHVLYAPAGRVAGSEQFPTSPVSEDAVLLLGARVDPAYAGGGIGRILVQAMAKDLIQRSGIRAVEAFGTTFRSTQPCLLPVDFLLSVGFRTHRAHPTTPRMRMDFRTVLTWRSELESALERLLAPVRAPAAPPTARARRTAQTRTTQNRAAQNRKTQDPPRLHPER